MGVSFGQASEVTTVELNVNMHCEACADQLKRKILKMRGKPLLTHKLLKFIFSLKIYYFYFRRPSLHHILLFTLAANQYRPRDVQLL